MVALSKLLTCQIWHWTSPRKLIKEGECSSDKKEMWGDGNFQQQIRTNITTEAHKSVYLYGSTDWDVSKLGVMIVHVGSVCLWKWDEWEACTVVVGMLFTTWSNHMFVHNTYMYFTAVKFCIYTHSSPNMLGVLPMDAHKIIYGNIFFVFVTSFLGEYP